MNSTQTIPTQFSRKAEWDIESIFLNRRSSRAMSAEPLPEADLMRLFEAARWAPSAYNDQEWRFLYARRGTKYWPAFLSLLIDPNRTWCERASALVVVTAHKTFAHNGTPNAAYSFDAGAACENLLLQGCTMNLVVHPMMGFDREGARKALHIPDDYSVEAMIAIGKPGDPAILPSLLQQREAPSGRKPVAEIIREGAWQA